MPAELQARYAGAPALLATSVVDSHYVDQAKRLVTEEERALSLVMRRVGPAFTAMQRALDGTNAAAQVLESAETLKQGLLDSEVFWRERPDAMTWAREAREHLDIVQKDTTGGNWEGARQAAGRVQFACQRCHQQYREELDDGTFRIRATPPTGGA